MKFLFYITLFLFGLVACKSSAVQETRFQTADLTPENSFTPGVEGPAVDKMGNVYAVNFAEQGTIGIVRPDGTAEVYVTLPEGSVGNGIRFDKAGNMYIADYPQHNVLKVDADRNIMVFAHEPRMNQPNDLAIAKNGQLFASDPNWGASTGQLWRIDPDGSVHLLEANMSTTNGIEVSADEQHLYVAESVSRKVWVYDLSTDGSISNKQLLIEFPDHGMDGIRCDAAGNLYITRYGKGTVAILTPDGKLKREVVLTGKKPSNIAFGGPDGKTCYVTLADRGNIETFRTDRPGRAWKLK